MKHVGTTDHGEVVELNRKRRRERSRHLREPEPRPDGRRAQVGRPSASAATGACARTTTRRRCATASRTWTRARARSRRASSAWGASPNKALNVFHIETTINNRMFDRPLEFLHKNEDDWTGAERAAFKGARVHALEAAAAGAPGDLPARALARTA